MKKYPKVRTVGHRDISNLLVGPVVVQEKVDGSNFSFGRGLNGKLFAWSRTQELDLEKPDGMFAAAADYIKSLDSYIPDCSKDCLGVIYRCEYLQKPKHNVLAYDRVPKNHLVLYEVEYLRAPDVIENLGMDRGLLDSVANMLQIDVIPEFWRGEIGPDAFPNLVKNWHLTDSFLGGQKVEGVVIKNFNQTDERTGATYLVGKVVREEFKEVHKHQVKLDKPDPVSIIGARCGGPARWRKAEQALKERGELTGSMEDIPKLMRYVQLDVATEEEDDIKEALWKLYRKNVLGCTTKGLPEWWKQKLAAEYTDGGAGI
jgi:hypothetical protein